MTSPLDSIPLACPLDGLALERRESGFVCQHNHSYDMARQGYVNLLPVQFKSSLEPGDSKSMVSARRSVMEQHHFRPLADWLCEHVLKHTDFFASHSGCLIDAGCGEGYYTALLAQQLRQQSPLLGERLLGIDISKWSIQAAAKQYQSVAFAVANNKRLPVCTGTASGIVSVFGFETWQPWSHLQTPGQLVFVVDAGPQHLLELRQHIYSEVRIHDAPDYTDAIKHGYILVETSDLKYRTAIDNTQSLRNILEMTPHGRRTNLEQLNKLSEIATMNLTIDAVIRTYRRS